MKNIFIFLKKIASTILLSPAIWIYWFVLSFLYYLDFSGLFIFSFMFIFVLFFNFIPYYLIRKMESKFHVVDTINVERFSHILVLGGGHVPDSEVLIEQQLNHGSLRRVLEGVRLSNLIPNSLLIMSGESLKKGHPSQAEIQAEVAMTMGVKKDSIEVISEPYNTEQEAICYLRKFNFHNNPLYLVTKALHQKRAGFIFSSFGFTVIPSPSYFVYRNFNPSLGWFLAPDFSLIIHFGEYLKEVVGFNFLKLQLSMGLKSFPSEKYDVESDVRRSSFEVFNR